MFPRARQQQAYLAGMCVFSAMTRVIMVALPLSLGMVINGLGEVIPWKAIVVYISIRFLASQAGFSLVENWLSHRVTTDLMAALNRHCYAHIMNMSSDFHDAKRSSVIWSTMHQGNDVIDLLHEMFFRFLPTTIDLVSAAVVLTYLFGLYMTFIVMATIILFYWLTFTAMDRKRTLRRTWIDAFDNEYYHMTESSNNWSTVSQFGRIPHETQVYHEKSELTRTRMQVYWFYECWTTGLRYVVPTVGCLAACSVAALQIAHGRHKVGDFVVLVTYWSQLMGPLATLAGELTRMTEKLVNAEKLLVLLEKTPHIQDDSDAKSFKFIEGAVDFENVSFSYDGKRQVTDGVTFRASPGKTIALVGQTGGGKSTLLKLLFRFYDVEHGRILIDGQDIRHVKMESFRKHIAVVPQTPAVFNMTVLENVKYPDNDCPDEDAIEACKAAALHDKVMSFTRGYQEKVGERGTKLSGGELQRLAIARSILKKGDILLLDEATSSVDSITEKQIQSSIRHLCRGKTAFVIAHRLSTILHADYIMVVKDGQIIECGTHTELLKKKGAYDELWSNQSRLDGYKSHSKSRSRSPRKKDAAVLVNDMSSGRQQVGKITMNKGSSGVQQEDATSNGASSDHNHEHQGHQTSHAASEERGRTSAKQLVRALGRRLSYSKSPKRGDNSKTGLKADAPEFVPRRFPNGQEAGKANGSSSMQSDRSQEGSLAAHSSRTPVHKENELERHMSKTKIESLAAIPEIRPSVTFPLKRQWDGHSTDTSEGIEDDPSSTSESCQTKRNSAKVENVGQPNMQQEQNMIRSLLENVRRRQTASEPLRQSDGVEDDASCDDTSSHPPSQFSRLPQKLPRRTVSAFERLPGHSSGDETGDGSEGSKPPVNTAATSPTVLTPKSNVEITSHSPIHQWNANDKGV